METIFQSIEILSKEKGIDPQIVLDAVKDAMLIAARKHYRTNEDYVADMDPKTGAIKLYAVKKVVEAVEDPAHEMTLGEARRIDSKAEIGGEVRIGAQLPGRVAEVLVALNDKVATGDLLVRLDDEELQAPSIVGELARRVSSGAAERLDEDHDEWSELLAPGDVTFVSSELGDTLAALPGAGDGLVVSTVAEWLIREESTGDDDGPELRGDASVV